MYLPYPVHIRTIATMQAPFEKGKTKNIIENDWNCGWNKYTLNTPAVNAVQWLSSQNLNSPITSHYTSLYVIEIILCNDNTIVIDGLSIW